MRYTVALMTIVGLLLLAGCSPAPPVEPAAVPSEVPVSAAPAEEPVSAASPEPETVLPPVETSEVREIVVKASNFKFEPSTITVQQGERVRIVVDRVEGTHNLFLEGYDQRVSVKSSPSRESFEFIADQAGSFQYWCEVGSHRRLGMEGTLTVIA